MAINSTLGLLDFSKYVVIKVRKILKDGKINWRDIPEFIAILLKIKLFIVGLTNIQKELKSLTDVEVIQLVNKCKEIVVEIDLLIKQNDKLQTSLPVIDMGGFNEEEFRLAIQNIKI